MFKTALITTLATAAVLAALPAISAARIALHGQSKLAVIEGEVSNANHQYPAGFTNYLMEHCENADQSSVRSNWAVAFNNYTYEDHHPILLQLPRPGLGDREVRTRVLDARDRERRGRLPGGP